MESVQRSDGDGDEDQHVDDEADGVGEFGSAERLGEPRLVAERVGPGRRQQVADHTLHDARRKPAQQHDDHGGEHVRQEGQELLRHRLDGRQQALQFKSPQRRRQEQQKHQPVDDVAQGR